MTVRTIAKHLPLPYTNHGNGFVDYGFSNQLGFLDPYIILSEFEMSQAYFPPHPHAGFSVMTYLFEDSRGAFVNRDSFGDHSIIEAGALHWTQAGRGIQHEEIPQQEGQVCHGLQMWINHSDKDRLSEPTRFHVDSGSIPEVRPQDGIRIRVLVGEAFGVNAPFQPLTPIHFLDVYLEKGVVLTFPTSNKTAFVMLISGKVYTSGLEINSHEVGTFNVDGHSLELRAGEEGCHFLLGTGQPFNQPIVYGGPFVMTTQDQLLDAKRRFSRGEMGTLTPSAVFSVDPKYL
jgi:redox-sensitive bicupin YhaK (pirin superfamily)